MWSLRSTYERPLPVRWHDPKLPMQTGRCTTGREDLPNDARRWHRPGRLSLFLGSDPAPQLAVALSTLEQLEARARQIERQWQLRLERVQYEADLAHRRYNAVDPDNRLVARSLERDWNAKLTEVEQLQREHAALPKPAALLITAQERERILALA